MLIDVGTFVTSSKKMNQEADNEIPNAENGIDFGLATPTLKQKLWMIDRVTKVNEKIGTVTRRLNFYPKHFTLPPSFNS